MDSITEGNRDAGVSKLFWAIMIIGFLTVGGIVAYFLSQPAPPPQEIKLANAVREGSPDFEYLKQRVVVQEQRDLATQVPNVAGMITMKLPAVVKNFSGKTLTGLEVIASVTDDKDKVIKERTSILIPTQVTPIENNKSALVNVDIEGFTKNDNRANFKYRVTAIKVE